MTHTFEEAIELGRESDDAWRAQIPEGWDFMGIANGGLVSSVMVTALAAATGLPDPITSTAHFLRPAFPGPVLIDAAVIRVGRTLTTARAELKQKGKLIAHLVAAIGDLSEVENQEPIVEIDVPHPPPPSDCVGPEDDPNFQAPPIAHRLGLRLDPRHTSFTRGEVSEPIMGGWVYVPFGAPTTMMPVVCDAMPPPFFNTGLYFGPLPTVELTVHTYRRPADGPVAALFKTDQAGPRYLEEDGWISDIDGKLVAVSRQIAALPSGG